MIIHHTMKLVPKVKITGLVVEIEKRKRSGEKGKLSVKWKLYRGENEEFELRQVLMLIFMLSGVLLLIMNVLLILFRILFPGKLKTFILIER